MVLLVYFIILNVSIAGMLYKLRYMSGMFLTSYFVINSFVKIYNSKWLVFITYSKRTWMIFVFTMKMLGLNIEVY